MVFVNHQTSRESFCGIPPHFLIDLSFFFVLPFMPKVAQKKFRLSRIAHWSLFSDAPPRQTGGLLERKSKTV